MKEKPLSSSGLLTKEQILQAAGEALNSEYPEAARLTEGQRASITFTDKSNILGFRMNSINNAPSSVSDAVTNMLRSFRIPKKEFDSWRNQSFPENSHSDYGKPEFYLPSSILNSLMTAGLSGRIRAAVTLGNIVIEQAITAMPYKIEPFQFEDTPWGFFWGFMIRKEAEGFLSPLEKYLPDKKARIKFRKAKTEILDFFTTEGIEKSGGVFTAVGAKVLYLLPGQPLTSPERVLGVQFDRATVHILAAPVKLRFLSLLEEFSECQIKVEESTDEENDPELEATGFVHKALGLRGKKLFAAYIHSESASRYMSTNNPLVNPFNYATGYRD